MNPTLPALIELGRPIVYHDEAVNFHNDEIRSAFTPLSVDDALRLVPGDLVFFGEDSVLPSKTYGFTPFVVIGVEPSTSGATVSFGVNPGNGAVATTSKIDNLARVADLNHLAALIAQFPQSR